MDIEPEETEQSKEVVEKKEQTVKESEEGTVEDSIEGSGKTKGTNDISDNGENFKEFLYKLLCKHDPDKKLESSKMNYKINQNFISQNELLILSSKLNNNKSEKNTEVDEIENIVQVFILNMMYLIRISHKLRGDNNEPNMVKKSGKYKYKKEKLLETAKVVHGPESNFDNQINEEQVGLTSKLKSKTRFKGEEEIIRKKLEAGPEDEDVKNEDGEIDENTKIDNEKKGYKGIIDQLRYKLYYVKRPISFTNGIDINESSKTGNLNIDDIIRISATSDVNDYQIKETDKKIRYKLEVHQRKEFSKN